jgi:hypothetical protein
MIRHHHKICEEGREGAEGETDVDAVSKELYHKYIYLIFYSSRVKLIFTHFVYSYNLYIVDKIIWDHNKTVQH